MIRLIEWEWEGMIRLRRIELWYLIVYDLGCFDARISKQLRFFIQIVAPWLSSAVSLTYSRAKTDGITICKASVVAPTPGESKPRHSSIQARFQQEI